jgi:hypothetical protein
LIEIFKDRKDVFDEGLMVIQALASQLEAQFDEFVPSIGPYLLHAIKEENTLKQGASTITEIC